MDLELPDVVTTLTHGYDALRPEIRAAELTRFRPGAYLPTREDDVEAWKRRRTVTLARCAAVAEKFTTRFAFSHATAALLHGWIDSVHETRVHLVQTVRPGAGQPGDVVRHVGAYDQGEVTLIDGLPVTGVEQTVLDCARYLPSNEALGIVDGAFRVEAAMSKFRRSASQVRQELLRERIRQRLGELGSVRGVRRARTVLELADGFADNPGESRMRWVALRGGLPVPTCQYELWAAGRQYFADAAWVCPGPEGPRLVIAEFDGEIKYSGAVGASAVVSEKHREDAIRRSHRAGFARLTWPALARPDAALAELLEAFPSGYVPLLEPRQELQVRPVRLSRRRDRRSSPSS